MANAYILCNDIRIKNFTFSCLKQNYTDNDCSERIVKEY